MRAFVAVDVGPSGGEAAGGPSHPEHLTLAFLGEVPADTVLRVVAALRPVARASAPFEMTIEGVGSFPSAARPRVVWLGIGRGRREIVELAGRVRDAVRSAGAPCSDETFVPHLTLFRVRSASGARAADELLSGERPPPAPRTERVEAFVLKESRLGPTGAEHRVVEAFPLGTRAEGIP